MHPLIFIYFSCATTKYMLSKRKDAVILDVGVGSGYLAAAMARMNPTATVYGVDIYTPLVKMAEANMRKQVIHDEQLNILIL